MRAHAVAGLPMSEADWQALVIDYAHAFGWRVAHFRPVRVERRDGSVYFETPVQADGAGFPDLVLARDGRVIFAELKSDRGRESREQRAWLAELGADVEWGGRDVIAVVWRPRDEAEVKATLRSGW